MSTEVGTFLKSTLAYCGECGRNELARIVSRENGVFMERICARGTPGPLRIAASTEWFMKRVYPFSVKAPHDSRPNGRGCPFDCGLCPGHIGKMRLAVFSITNDCNLDCNICFTYNRKDLKYYKSPDSVARTLDHILSVNERLDLINLTGGEPTLHPKLFEVLDVCRRDGIGLITMNSNGLRIARDPEFARAIRESGVHVVLSLDTFIPERSVAIHGADIVPDKMKALETLESLGIPTTILSVCIKDLNEDEVAEIASKFILKDFIKGIAIQNMTFTGRNGSRFMPREHITIDEVERLLESRGLFSQEDFFSPGSCHPLCYSAAYYLVHGSRAIPLNRLLDGELMLEGSEGRYFLDPDADYSRALQDGINRLWSEGEDEETIGLVRRIAKELYPDDRVLNSEERRSIAEKYLKLIYIHSHMDADNFDIERVGMCGDLVPDESGSMIPACSYNMLYRQRDPRFWTESGA